MPTPKKIVLFTPFPPTMGGGGQNLRMALPHLKDVEITWAYLNSHAVEFPNSLYLGPSVIPEAWGSSFFTMGALCSGKPVASIQAIVQKLLALKPDRFWLVAHYEGNAVAEGLLAAGADVHISIHDDPVALMGRSRRYFWWAKAALAQLGRILKKARSADCTSYRMSDRYKKLFGTPSITYFPYVAALPVVPKLPEEGPVRVGYAGSLYSPQEPQAFAKALQIYTQRTCREVEFHLWGLNPRQQSYLKNSPVPVIFHPFAKEEVLVGEMMAMNMLYVMYPFDKASEIFCQTSHPAKLSTYLKIQRPILAHTPLQSSLADFVIQCNLGVVCDRCDPSILAGLMQTLLSATLPLPLWAKARDGWYGEKNLAILQRALTEGQV